MSRCAAGNQTRHAGCCGGHLHLGTRLRGGIELCLFHLGAALLATVRLLGLKVLGGTQSATGAATQNIHQCRIGHDRTDQQETGKARQLGTGEAQHKRPKCQNTEPHQKRHHLDSKGRADRQQCKDHCHHRVAEKPTQTKAVGLQPFGIGRQRGRIDRPKRHRNRSKDQPAHRTVFTAVQRKAQPPGQQHNRQTPGPPAHDHEQRRGK